MQNDGLLPCPFCGGVKSFVGETLDQKWYATCYLDHCAFVGHFDTEAEAITAWNTRIERSHTAPSGDDKHPEISPGLPPPSSGEGRTAGEDRLREMADAPKDGRYILAVYKSLDGYALQLDRRAFVIRHEGETSSGYDLGWALFPGHGGVPDKCLSGWLPLPAALAQTKGGDHG